MTKHTTYKIGDKEVSQSEYLEHKEQAIKYYNKNLLIEFVNFLNKCYYNIGMNPTIDRNMDQFLEERELEIRKRRNKINE